MKNYNYLGFILLSTLLFSACSNDTEYVDSKDPASIFIKDIESNTVDVYTTKTFQVEVGILPANAEIKDKITFAYSSSDKKVFEVSSTGLITATAVGQAVLTIQSTNYDNLITKVIVKVTDEFFAVEEIKINDSANDQIIALSSETVVGQTLDLSTAFTILPEHASIKDVEFISSDKTIASVSEKGHVQGFGVGEATITIKAKDGSDVSGSLKVSVKAPTSYNSLDRSGWLVDPSHRLPKDAAISNAPESLIDGNSKTCLSMVKPGKSYDGIKVAKGESVFFIIDRKNKEEFNYVSIQHRENNSLLYLRPYTYTLFGKNEESEEFTPIYQTIYAIPSAKAFTMAIPATQYRFVKFIIAPDAVSTSGSTMQIAELELGKMVF